MDKVVSKVYKHLNANQTLLAEKVKKWEKELHMEINYEDFIQVTRSIYHVMNIVKYRSFQYRLLQ